MVTGRGLSLATLLTVALAVAALSWGGWTIWTRGGRLLMPVSVFAPLLLLAIAALVLAAAAPVRRFLRGGAGPRLDPMRAARVLAMAQAAGITGAAAAGWYAGQLPVLLGDLRLQTYQRLLWPVLAAAVAGVALASTGLLAQRWCRVDPPDEDDSHR